jgi:hypothetical protein
MLQDTILSKINELPEKYQMEVLDFSEFLLSKVIHNKNIIRIERGGFGARKNDYIMADDFDEPLEDFKEYQ